MSSIDAALNPRRHAAEVHPIWAPHRACVPGAASKAQSTWRPFLFPPVLSHLPTAMQPCEPWSTPPTSGAWIPVTHTFDAQDADTKGLWFYMAAGCSDMLLWSGRTLYAHNRAHAAVLLMRRSNGMRSDRIATERVAEWVRRRKANWYAVGKARRLLGMPKPKVERESDRLERAMLLIGEAARGLGGECEANLTLAAQYDDEGRLQPCRCAAGKTSVTSHAPTAPLTTMRPGTAGSTRRVAALSWIAGDPVANFSQRPRASMPRAHKEHGHVHALGGVSRMCMRWIAEISTRRGLRGCHRCCRNSPRSF